MYVHPAGHYLLIDGATVQTDNGILGGKGLIGPGNGGLPEERWSRLGKAHITESRRYSAVGRTFSLSPGSRDVLLRDGDVVYREGGSVGDVQLAGFTHSYSWDLHAMNEAGDIAFLWEIEAAGSSTVDALFLNTRLLAKAGDPIDLDGDGAADTQSHIVSLRSRVGISAGRRVFFRADVDVSGTTETMLLAVDDPCGSVRRFGVGCAGVGGFVPRLHVGGCSVAGGAVDLQVNDAPGGSVALLFLGAGRSKVPTGVSGCFFNVAPLLLPLPIALPLSGSGAGNGSVVVPVTIPANTPPGLIALQAWVADPSHPLGAVASQVLRL